MKESITHEALEALIVELRCGDPSGAKCDKASDMLLAICQALRTGQLVPAQPSGDEVEAVAEALRAHQASNRTWRMENLATAAITAYEAVSGVAKMRDALEEMRDHRTELNDRSDYARGWNEARWKVKKLARAALGEKP